MVLDFATITELMLTAKNKISVGTPFATFLQFSRAPLLERRGGHSFLELKIQFFRDTPGGLFIFPGEISI